MTGWIQILLSLIGSGQVSFYTLRSLSGLGSSCQYFQGPNGAGNSRCQLLWTWFVTITTGENKARVRWGAGKREMGRVQSFRLVLDLKTSTSQVLTSLFCLCNLLFVCMLNSYQSRQHPIIRCLMWSIASCIMIDSHNCLENILLYRAHSQEKNILLSLLTCVCCSYAVWKHTRTLTPTEGLEMWCRWLSVPQERVIFTEGKVPKYHSPGQQLCDCCAGRR